MQETIEQTILRLAKARDFAKAVGFAAKSELDQFGSLPPAAYSVASGIVLAQDVADRSQLYMSKSALESSMSLSMRRLKKAGFPPASISSGPVDLWSYDAVDQWIESLPRG